MLWDSQNSWKASLPPAGCESIFSAGSCQGAWSGGSTGAKDQVNMADGTEPHSPLRSMSEALVVWRAVGHCCGGELGLFCWSLLATSVAVSVHLIDLLRLHYLLRYITSVPLRCNGFARIQKAVVDQSSSRPPNSDHLFWVQVWLQRTCFGAASRSNHWAGHRRLSYTIHFFSSHVTIQSRNGSLLLSIHMDITRWSTLKSDW